MKLQQKIDIKRTSRMMFTGSWFFLSLVFGIGPREALADDRPTNPGVVLNTLEQYFLIQR